MGTLVYPELENVSELERAELRNVVAREGSELAVALRAGGWVARAGWRALDSDPTRPVWFVRFERPGQEHADA
jgi:hypothetical protein